MKPLGKSGSVLVANYHKWLEAKRKGSRQKLKKIQKQNQRLIRINEPGVLSKEVKTTNTHGSLYQ